MKPPKIATLTSDLRLPRVVEVAFHALGEVSCCNFRLPEELPTAPDAEKFQILVLDSEWLFSRGDLFFQLRRLPCLEGALILTACREEDWQRLEWVQWFGRQLDSVILKPLQAREFARKLPPKLAQRTTVHKVAGVFEEGGENGELLVQCLEVAGFTRVELHRAVLGESLPLLLQPAAFHVVDWEWGEGLRGRVSEVACPQGKFSRVPFLILTSRMSLDYLCSFHGVASELHGKFRSSGDPVSTVRCLSAAFRACLGAAAGKPGALEAPLCLPLSERKRDLVQIATASELETLAHTYPLDLDVRELLFESLLTRGDHGAASKELERLQLLCHDESRMAGFHKRFADASQALTIPSRLAASSRS